MSDAQDGAIQALERKIEKRLSVIEKRQDDLDLVVVDQAAMSFRLKTERDDARAAAQADEIARLKIERDENVAWVQRIAFRVRDEHIAGLVAKSADLAAAVKRAEVAEANSHGAGVRADNAERREQHVKEAHADTAAKLGRAVAALQGVVAESDRNTHAYKEAHPILADADSAVAGEAHSELVAVYEAAKLLPLNGHGGNCTCAWCALNAALARVDARRGGKR